MNKPRPAVFRIVVAALALIAAGYVFKTSELYLNQSRYIFFPEREWVSTPASKGLHFRDVRFTAADGVLLSAWYVPHPNAKGTVIFFHGNARNISGEIGVLEMFHELGFNAVALDYRGYGKSGGKPDEKGMYLDAEAAWKFAVETLGEKPQRVVVWGRSLGSAVAADLASRKTTGALVVEASFKSVPDVAQERYPMIPVRIFLRYKYDTLSSIRETKCPVLVVHSREDRVIPISHGRAVYDAAPGPKRFLEIAGPHGGLPFQQVYADGVKKFFEDFWKGEATA